MSEIKIPNIFLIGFMGCGKSTVARELNRQYAMPVVEMDQLISEQENMSIPDIFRIHGEEYFRRLETELLSSLADRSGCVVSCGGGVAMRSENVSLMKKQGYTALLSATPETILGRVARSNDRPLLNGHKNVQDITELLNQRLPKYTAAADFTVPTDNQSASVLAVQIYEKVLSLASFSS